MKLFNHFITLIILFFIQPNKLNAQNAENPNIIIIYVDDLGFGDIGVNGAIGVKTPNVDQLAKEGINFSDVHSSSATCTPSRYSLLTGSYAFRAKANILPGDAPLLINPDTRTIADLLKDAGYTTGVVGKWHLGLGNGKINWNKRVSPGPFEVGFDYSFLIPATGDRIPTVYLENQEVVNLNPDSPIVVDYQQKIKDGYPSGREHPELLKQYTDNYHLDAITNGISRIGFMKGGEEALWVDENIPYDLTGKAISFIEKHQQKPFFLYFSLHDIHQPRIANVKFIESSTMGPRGDVIAQMDWCVGQIMKAVEQNGLKSKTVILFTSDNGPILDDGYVDYARELVGDHKPGGPYRGSKYSIFEAGTRMPTILSWPGRVSPQRNSALLSQVDLYSSLASLVNQKLNESDAPDSKNHLQAWLGKTNKARTFLYEQAYAHGIRMNQFKYIHPKNNIEIPIWISEKFVDPGFTEQPLLFNLKNDPGETKNIADDHPKIVLELNEYLKKVLKSPTREGYRRIDTTD